MSALCSVSPGAAPAPHSPGPAPPKSKAPRIWAWEGQGGSWVSRPLAAASRQPWLQDWGLPGPSIPWPCPPTHPPM